MTTLTTPPATTTGSPQWRRAFGYLLSGHVYMLTLWFWAIAIPVVAIVMFIVGQYVDPVSMSAMAFTHHGALWFPFSIAIILAVTYLPIHVANGMTRRSFSQAAILVSVVVAVLNAAIATAALLVEEQIYDALGWIHGSNNESAGILVFEDGVLTYALGLLLLFLGGQISGSLIGIAYYRLGGIAGTLALPLSMLPLLGVTFLGLDKSSQWVPWSIGPGTTWGTVSAVIVIAAGIAAFHYLVRDIQIDSKD